MLCQLFRDILHVTNSQGLFITMHITQRVVVFNAQGLCEDMQPVGLGKRALHLHML